MNPLLRLAGLASAACLICLSAALSAPPASGKSEKVKWQPDLLSAHQLATAEKKPILLVFGADWCGYCKKLENETINAPEMARYINNSFVAVHLDADKDKRVVELLEVNALPCTIILSPEADLLGRIEGYHTAGPFYQKLAAARQKHETIQPTSERR